MTLTVEAIHENGVLKPVQPLPLKEQERVQVTVHTANQWVSETAGKRRATMPSSAFNRASWASNFACRRRQLGQDFRALGLMTGYATQMVWKTQHR